MQASFSKYTSQIPHVSDVVNGRHAPMLTYWNPVTPDQSGGGAPGSKGRESNVSTLHSGRRSPVEWGIQLEALLNFCDNART